MALNNMEHFLVFIDAADDAATYPLSALAGITCAADATVKMWFNSAIAGGTGAGGTEADLVTLTVTADTEKTVMIAIADSINNATKYPKNTKNYTVIADDVNSVYCNSNITAVAVTLDS